MSRIVCVVLLCCAPVALAAQSRSELQTAVTSITAEDVQDLIGVLAHDSMRGRDTPSPEIELVADYVAGRFRSFGLRPLGDNGSYLQRYPLAETKLAVARSGIRITGGPRFALGEETQLLGDHNAPRVVGGPAIVLSGGGGGQITLTDERLGNAVVLLVHPAGQDGNFAPGLGSVLNPLMVQRDPPAVIVVSERSDTLFERQRSATVGSVIEPGWDYRKRLNHAVLEVQSSALDSVLARHGFDLGAAIQRQGEPLVVTHLPDLEITVEIHRDTLEQITAPNVVAMLEGTDPELKNEYVIFMAHMDHIGVGELDDHGDSVFNGADDNASGTAGLIELAQAFSLLDVRPKRSLIFLATSGEEKGTFSMWGSNYFATHSPVQLDRLIAAVNLDMIGNAWWPDTVSVIGGEHSDLGELVDRVARRHPELRLTTVGNVLPRLSYWEGSDHISFARRGIPVVFFSSSGPKAHYHQRSDELGVIDFDITARVSRLVFYVGIEIANSADRPQWNRESYEQIVW